jgi:hypothetical protein
MSECDLMRRAFNEALSMIASLVQQHCERDAAGQYDSMAISANAEAMEFLAEHGLFEIDVNCGRRVLGRFLPDH